MRIIMQKRIIYAVILPLFFTLLALPMAAHSASIKERMKARIPTIVALKNKGVIGENAQGFLEFRGKAHPQEEVIVAENADRKKVYVLIAKKQNVSPELVGQRRAQQIMEKGKKGHWFQGENGQWLKK